MKVISNPHYDDLLDLEMGIELFHHDLFIVNKNNSKYYEHGFKDSSGRKINYFKKKWYSNGNMMFQYKIKNGLYEGEQKRWYENGQIKYIKIYKNGKQIEEKRWYPNGDPYCKYCLENERNKQLEEKQTWYYDDCYNYDEEDY